MSGFVSGCLVVVANRPMSGQSAGDNQGTYGIHLITSHVQLACQMQWRLLTAWLDTLQYLSIQLSLGMLIRTKSSPCSAPLAS